jgi:asparagine synthase (glutamine-hydrolysing)
LLNLQRADDLPFPGSLKRLGLSCLRQAGWGESRAYEFLRRGALQQPIFWGGAMGFTEAQKQRLLSPRLKKRFEGHSSWEALQPLRTRFEQNAWEKSHLNWMSYLDLSLRLPELLLMRVDKMSMGVSLEGRVPFLDHKFVELAMSIPSSVKTQNGTLKHILKKAVRGVIPDELIDRPKQGFAVPIYEWFFDKLGARARAELNAFCDETDFLDRAQVNQLLDRNRGPLAWYLLNFALWWKMFIASNSPHLR